jgi:hypothetical protein
MKSFFKNFLLAVISVIMISACQNEINSSWITADHADCNEYNTWIEFNKDFDLKRVPGKVEMKLAADSKYWLWVNDRMVIFEGGLKRGPDPQSSYYDVVDVADFLKKGKNNIRILLWHFGKDGFSHKDSGKSGLIVEAQKIGLASDSSWKSRRLSEYQCAVNPEPNYRLSEANIRYDARIAGKDEWKNSVEIGVWGDEPWGNLVERPIPFWKDYGVKTVGFEKSHDDDGNTVLSIRLPYNMQLTPVIDVTDLGEGTVIKMQTNHIKGGSEYCTRAEYITKNGRQSYESLGWMNGEELYIIYPADAKININAVGYRETGFGCDFEGRFTCSDAIINRFWDKAMRTLYVNMRDTYFDCPDRERAQWWGDVTILSGQSNYQLSPVANTLTWKAIHELINWQKEDGTLYSPVPAGAWVNELPAQMLASISTYGFWYYYVNTGDVQTMKDVYPAMKKYLSLWSLDERGLTAFRKGGWSWGDWGTNIDLRLILAAWHYLALESASNIAELIGCPEDIPEYQRLKESIRKAYNECWNGTEYRHHDYEMDTDDRANAMAVITGIADESRYDAIFEHFKTHEHASPYMEKYVLEAMMKMGHGDYALERFKRRFGPMIKDPVYTTLFESWEVGGYGGGSTNHAWSGGMLTVIAENVCGVRPLEAGWKTFEVRPYPVIPECDITIPSVAGLIKSAFKADNETFTLKVTVPSGCKAKVVIPEDYSDIFMNGKTFKQDRILKAGSYEFICKK